MQTINNSIDPESLFWKFFAGEASEDEKQEILAWVKQSEANKKSFQVSREAYISAKHPAQETAFDSAAAHQKFVRSTAPARRMTRWIAISVAASVALVASIGLGFMLTRSPQHIPAPELAYTSAANETRSIVLPDSSTVSMHRQAKLVYAVQENNVRRAELSGEAFFDITHDAKQPFEVQAGDLTIRVLGTSFIVDAQPYSSEVMVRVLSGRVMVSAGAHSQILNANEEAVYHKNSGSLQMQKSFDRNDIAWKTNELVFNATPLTEVAAKLSKYFGCKISVQDSTIACYPLSAEFTEPKLESVLTLLQLTFGIQAVRTDSLVVLTSVKSEHN